MVHNITKWSNFKKGKSLIPDLYAGHTKEPAEDAGMLHHSDHSPQRRAGRDVQQQGRVLDNEAAKPHLDIGQILRRQSRYFTDTVKILHRYFA